MSNRFDRPSTVKLPPLTQIVDEAVGLTTSDLNNPDHPVNIASQSGKRAGAGLMIGAKIYIATGSEPHDPWDASSTPGGGGNTTVTVEAPNQAEEEVSGFVLGDGMSYEQKGAKAVLHAAVTEAEHQAVSKQAGDAVAAAQEADGKVAELSKAVTSNKQEADATKAAVPNNAAMSLSGTTLEAMLHQDDKALGTKKGINLAPAIESVMTNNIVSVATNKATKVIRFTAFNGTTTDVDLSDWFTDSGGGGTTPDKPKYHVISGFLPKTSSVTKESLDSSKVSNQEADSIDNLMIEDTRPASGGGSSSSVEAYMFVWIDDRLGEPKGFEFSGFLSVWDKVQAVQMWTKEGWTYGKVYISPNGTFAASVSYKIVEK